MAVDIIARGMAANAAKSAGKTISGYYYEGHFYKDAEHTQEITPKDGALYADKETHIVYMYDAASDTFIKIGGGGGDANIYTTTIVGDGTTTSFEIEHDLSTLYGFVVVNDPTDDEDVVCDIVRNNESKYTLVFATAPASGKTYNVAVASPQGSKGEPGKVRDIVDKDGGSIVDPETGIGHLPEMFGINVRYID